MALAANQDYHYVAAITSILSPRVSVVRNMKLLGMHLAGKPMPPDVYKQKRAAIAMYKLAKVLNGYKVQSFYHNLVGNLQMITLDTWMATAMLLDGRPWPSVVTPLVVEAWNRIRTTAIQLSWEPAQVQAAIWAATYLRHKHKEPPRLLAADAIGELRDPSKPHPQDANIRSGHGRRDSSGRPGTDGSGYTRRHYDLGRELYGATRSGDSESVLVQDGT